MPPDARNQGGFIGEQLAQILVREGLTFFIKALPDSLPAIVAEIKSDWQDADRLTTVVANDEGFCEFSLHHCTENDTGLLIDPWLKSPSLKSSLVSRAWIVQV